MSEEGITREEVYSQVERFILEASESEEDKIAESDNLVTKFGLDSVDFLDLIFELEEKFDIDIPVEDWQSSDTSQVSGDTDSNFIMSTFVGNVHNLVLNK